MTPGEIADIYLRYYEDRREEDAWAIEKADVSCNRDIEEALEITLILINKAKSNEALAYVAAGPLENLLTMHGPAVIDRIEKESLMSDRLLLALSGVWGLEPGNPIFERWYAIMWKSGFADGRREPL